MSKMPNFLKVYIRFQDSIIILLILGILGI
jgi:hypothetical protein